MGTIAAKRRKRKKMSTSRSTRTMTDRMSEVEMGSCAKAKLFSMVEELQSEGEFPEAILRDENKRDITMLKSAMNPP